MSKQSELKQKNPSDLFQSVRSVFQCPSEPASQNKKRLPNS